MRYLMKVLLVLRDTNTEFKSRLKSNERTLKRKENIQFPKEVCTIQSLALGLRIKKLDH